MKFYEEPERCHRCGVEGQLAHHHLIGGAYRKKADKLGLVIPLCPKCHEMAHKNADLNRQYRRYAQLIMLRQGWTVEQWIREFGKDYLQYKH